MTRQSNVGDGSITICQGCPRSGKTTLACAISAKEANQFHRRLVGVDPGEDVREYLENGHPVVGNRTKLNGYVATATDAKEIERKFNSKTSIWTGVAKPPAAVLLKYRNNDDTDERLRDELANYVDDPNKRGLVILLDEMELFVPNAMMSGRRFKALRLHGNRGQRWVCSAHRGQNANKYLRSIAQYVCIFAHNSEADAKMGTEVYGEWAVFEPCLELKKFEYLYRSPPMTRRYDEPLPRLSVVSSPLPW